MPVVVLLYLLIAGLGSGVGDHARRATYQRYATRGAPEGELAVEVVDLEATREQRTDLLLQTLYAHLLLQGDELLLQALELVTLVCGSSSDLLVGELADELVDLLLIGRAEELDSQWRGRDPLAGEQRIELIVGDLYASLVGDLGQRVLRYILLRELIIEHHTLLVAYLLSLTLSLLL